MVIALMVTGCSTEQARKVYLVSRTLLGYTPPPRAQSVKEQLDEELERCRKAGDEHCEAQALQYVRTVNDALKRPEYKGHVIITEDRQRQGDGPDRVDPENQSEADHREGGTHVRPL
jgi:hypothetical protein